MNACWARASSQVNDWRSRLAVAWVLLLVTSCPLAEANPEYEVVPSPFPILDSDFLVSSRNELFWLDEDRVLFVGSHKKKPLTLDEPRIGGFGLYIWDTRDNSVSMYREKVYGHLCYEDGWIHYTVNRARPYRYAAGPLGKERETTLVTRDDARQFHQTHFFSKTTCRYHERSTYGISRKDGKHVVPLGDSGNHLTVEIAFRGEVGETRFFRSGDKEGRRLPFDFSEFVVKKIKFYEYKKRYLLKPHHRNWVRKQNSNNENCTSAWWLDSDGSSELICIPSGPWNTPSSILFTPLRNGIALISHRVFDNRPSAGGLYFTNDDGHMKLFDGWVHAPATSPSGCRLALTHAPDLEASAYGRGLGKTKLKMIDFCARDP